MNAVEIEEAVSALAGAPFDPVEFPYAFLAAFGTKETTIKRLRVGGNNPSDRRTSSAPTSRSSSPGTKSISSR